MANLKGYLTDKSGNNLCINNLTILWTNPSPTSAMASQTIQLPDKANYNTFIIKWKDNKGGKTIFYNIIPAVGSTTLNATHVGDGGAVWRKRIVKTTEASVSFESGFIANNYQVQLGTASNDECIPLLIIGFNTNIV